MDIDWDGIREQADLTGYNPLEDDDPTETAITLLEATMQAKAREEYNRILADLDGYPAHVNTAEARLDVALTYSGGVLPTAFAVFSAMLDNGTIDAEAFWRTWLEVCTA
jgi:hypothetical protein